MGESSLGGIRRTTPWASAVAVVAGLLVVGPAPPANAATTINTAATPGEIAGAIDSTTGAVTGASFVAKPPSGTPTAVATSDPPLAGFPTDGSGFGILTSGDAALADDSPQGNFASVPDSGGNVRGNTDFDVSVLKVDLKVPLLATCLRIDFRFLSEEFPEYVGSTFNDAFIAELDTSDWTTSGSEITAPHNFAFDPQGNPISINSSGHTNMSAEEAAGTIYDGATAMLVAQTPVTAGEHSVYISIFDQGDQVYDSAVFLDNLSLGTQTGAACEKGAQPLGNLSLSVSPTTAQAGFDAMPKADIDYGALSSPGTAGGESLATAPAKHGPAKHGPAKHGPAKHGPVKHGSIIDADPAYRFASLAQLPLAHVPPILIAQVLIAEPPGPWEDALPPELAALPFQTVTVQQVASSSAATAISAGDLDLVSTPLGTLSPASLLLGNATLSQLGLTPPSGFTGGDALAKVEGAGQSLASLPVEDVTLANRASALSGSLISGASLSGIEWESTTGGWNAQVSQFSPSEQSTILDNCPAGGCGSETFAEARAAGHFKFTATLGDLLALPGAQSVFSGMTFGQLLPGILDVTNFPFARTPLSQILAAAELDPTAFVTYTAEADVLCPLAGDSATFTATLPGHGFRYAPDTATVKFGAGTPAEREPVVLGNDLTWTVSNAETCPPGASSQHVAFSYKVEPGPELGTFSSSLKVTTGDTTQSILEQAPLTTTENFEANNTPESPTPITTGTLYTDTLSGPSDIDYFNVPVTAADVGRTLEVDVTHLPGQDYDLVLYGFANSSTLRGAPAKHGPAKHGPAKHGPLADDGQCGPPDAIIEPQTMQDVPQLNSETFSIRSYSTNRSTTEEFACTVLQPQDIGKGITVQVSLYNAGSSPQPALVSAEMSAPVELLPCVPVPSTPGNLGPALPAPGSLSATTQTLFLLPGEAIGRFYGPAAQSDVEATVTDPTFLGMPNVQGAVLSLERDAGVSAAYSAWYGDYCSPEVANDVVRAINDLVDSYLNTGPGLPNLKHIVLVGPDAVLPSARIPDLVGLGNQSTEAPYVQFDNKDNPTSRAFALGHMVTDDPYYSFQPIPWLTTELYPMSVGGGRLVETPADIVAAINQYKTFNGILDPQTEFGTGYDFFTDGAQAKENVLHPAYDHPKSGPTTFASQINEAWTRNDLANGLNAAPGIAAIDAHADHYSFLPAAAYHATSVTDSDLYLTDDLMASAIDDGTLAFSIGCNAGVSVADVWVTASDPTTLDWAQAFAQQNSLAGLNSGFGYGDSALGVVAYSEKLTLHLAENLDGSMTWGQAIAHAKQQYYAGLGAWGVFDAKAVQEFTPFGLPMYVLGPTGQVGGPVPPTSPPPVTTDPDTGLPSTTLNFSNLNSGAVDTGDGVYYKGPTGQVMAEHYRPIQPVTTPQDLTQPGGLRLHGAVMLSFKKTEISPFTAAMSVPTLAPQTHQPPPRLKDASFPSEFVSTLSQDTIFGTRDTLVVSGGQFVSDPSGVPNTGTQRLFSDAAVRAYYSTSDEFSVPLLSSIQATDLGNTAEFEVKTPSPASEVAAIYVTFRRVGSNLFTSQAMTYNGTADAWKTSVNTSATKVAEYIVQIVATTGDVGVSTFKALFFPKPEPPPADPSAPVVTVTDANGNPVTASESGWYRKSPLTVNITKGNETFTAKVNGEPRPVPVTVSEDGEYIIEFEGSQGTLHRLDLRIDTQAPTLGACPGPQTFLVNSGSQTLVITGSDQGPSGLNEDESVLSATLDTASVGTKAVTFTAKDLAGNSVSKTCSYSVTYKFEGFFSPIDNPPVVNLAKAGQGLAIKYRLTDANGVGISDPAHFLRVVAENAPTACTGSTDAIETYEGSSGLQYLGGGNWQFNWRTPKKYAGTCKTMLLHLNDGVVPTEGGPRSANFRFS
jgi:hypothetical protein